MIIKILGTGCSRCKTLYQTVTQAVQELGLDAEVIKEEDLINIMNYQVMTLPAIVADERVLAKGTLSLTQVKELLTELQK